MPAETEPVGKGYALWLMPEEPMFNYLATRISRLSQTFSTPLFEPHVTLLAGITMPEKQVVAKCTSLPGLLRRFRIELGDIGHSNEYFRCLFVSVIPTNPIIKAHRTAREAFGYRDKQAYLPHLSLLYGKLSVETRKGVATAYSFLSSRAFEARHLALYRVSGVPHEWMCAEKFDLR